MGHSRKQHLVIVGGGMTAWKFVELFTDMRGSEEWELEVIGEEPRRPWDRVHLTEFFGHRDARKLELAPAEWYRRRGVRLRTGRRVTEIDAERRLVRCDDGAVVDWDRLLLATGSAPFVPPVAGIDEANERIHVYRTIEDVRTLLKQAELSQCAAVMGGGLLGLEAARALQELGLQVDVLEYGDRLMARQLDHRAGTLLRQRIERLGVRVHTGFETTSVTAHPGGLAIEARDGTCLAIDLLVVAAGIRPRDELAATGGLECGARGGFAVDRQMRTSRPGIFAAGECAAVEDQLWGLVAPCYQMAEVAAANILGQSSSFTSPDTSTRLKLMGVDVAVVGDPLNEDGATSVVVEDQAAGTYRKLLIDEQRRTLRGAILFGDTGDYPRMVQQLRSEQEMPEQPIALFVDGVAATVADGDALVCTCNDVTASSIRSAVRDGATALSDVCSATGAGTGCGGCKPQVRSLIEEALAAEGRDIRNEICACLPWTRAELVDMLKVTRIEDYQAVLDRFGRGPGCEVCKPVVASLFSTLYGDTAADHPVIQDTNDRFLANIQRGGTYSVVPRIPGGEITADQLITIGEVAREFGLYVKLTGGQRIDLFGARVDQLPRIWERLIDAGFESGHAYAKGMRTVKSCVGSTWCRFGLLDSTAFAIELEHRYKGMRFPHKVKAAVSGCIRECAEARSKDFGVIATEQGWNLYVGGNGGARPRHAELLATGLDNETCVRYIDRFLMYYALTAEPLMRTAAWLEQLEGGIDQLRRMIIDDVAGICAELDEKMNDLVGWWRCEWRQVVETPELREQFRAFVNTDEPDPEIRFVEERGQIRPANGGGFVELSRIGRIRAA